jgi:oxygen-dependent protoporphyrinogen oxidase
MGALIEALERSVVERGGVIRTGASATSIEVATDGLRIDGRRVAAIVLACPAAAAAGLLSSVSPEASRGLASVEAASVVMVTMAIPAEQWRRGRGGDRFSGYLVPKADQRHVTAVSFASNKWAHWRLPDGGMVLRVSLGRDGLPAKNRPEEWDDERLISTVLAEVGDHLAVELAPTATRISRWPGAFPQYRPGHLDRLAAIEAHLRHDVPGVVLAGASHRGMGIPACVQQGQQSAAAIGTHLAGARD